MNSFSSFNDVLTVASDLTLRQLHTEKQKVAKSPLCAETVWTYAQGCLDADNQSVLLLEGYFNGWQG